MNVLRIGLSALLVTMLSSTAYSQATRTVSRTFDLSRTGTVTLSSYKGSVDVRTTDTETVRVDVRIEGDEQTHVNQTKIRFSSSPTQLDIETDYDEVEGNQKLFGLFSLGSMTRPATEYTLEIPRTANLTVETYSASTHVTDLSGRLQYDAYSAPLTVNRLEGPLHATTYSGSAHLTHTGGPVRMETYSGALQADSLSGPVTFTSFSGTATLGFSTLTHDCRFESFSGTVTIALPSTAGAVVETTEAAFESDVPARIEQVGDDRVRATISGGGPRLSFETFSGTLTLQRP